MKNRFAPSVNIRSHAPFLCVWILSAVYLWQFMDRGWIAGDEGLLAQSAERVLQGELPHRDFDDMYTGGQALLHALAFRIFGVELTSLRLLLYLTTLLALPLFYALARRAASPGLAAFATLTTVVWTLPNYFASMPSWYNLFLTFAALLALLRAVDRPETAKRWFLLAGVFAGLSFLIKSSALLLVAAAFLFFVYREQEINAARAEIGEAARGKAHSLAFALFTCVGLGLFLTVLTSFISKMPRPSEFAHFIGPALCLCGVLLVRTRQPSAGTFFERFGRLLQMALPFLAGILIPCFFFLLIYARAGGLDALLGGDYLFVEKRLEYTVFPLPRLATMLAALPVLILFLWSPRRPAETSAHQGESPKKYRGLLLAALPAAVLIALGNSLYVYQTIWFSVRPLTLVFVLVGCFLLWRSPPEDGRRRQELFLILAVTAILSVTQFPYSWAIYFCYVAPLVLLAGLFTARARPVAPRKLYCLVLIFYTAFGALWLNLGTVQSHGIRFLHRPLDTPLPMQRGGIQVGKEDAKIYATLVDLVQKHSKNDAYILALPDCPEVYFLSGRRNPTRSFCDYFEDDYGDPRRVERLLELIDEHEIEVVVLHWRPAFSELPPDFAQEVFERFPYRTPLPPRFTVHWRDSE